jgi:hypothetical protein
MGLQFPEFIRRFQLLLLGVTNSDIVPGAVLDKAKRGYLFQGHARQLVAQPDSFWSTEQNQADIIQGSVDRELTLGGKASLDEMGVKIEGGLKRARSATFSITGVSARTFADDAATKFSLMPLILALRKTDKAKWKMVNGKWIVFETYYATEATMTFVTAGNVDLKADVEEAGGVSVQGGGNVTWKGKKSFSITGNRRVPFAFRGWQV